MNVINLAGSLDREFSNFFKSIGYGVTYEGRRETGERWHEIYDGMGIVCQVAFGVPLAEFLADLPHLIEGRSGVGPTDYWVACKDLAKLRELFTRAKSARCQETGDSTGPS